MRKIYKPPYKISIDKMSEFKDPAVEQVLGQFLSERFADFRKEAIESDVEIPDSIPANIADKVRIDTDEGILQFSPTQEDLDGWSDLTDDHNIVHRADSPEFAGGFRGPVLHGNYIAALAESLVRQYFDAHHKEKVNDYFDGKILSLIRRFFVRRGVIGTLNYRFKEAFRPDQQLVLKVTDFSFKNAQDEDKDCMFSMDCELKHPESDVKGSISIEYLLRLPESPKLYDVLEKEGLEVTCTDTVVVDKEELDTYREKINQLGKHIPVLFPLVRTNSKVLLKHFDAMKKRPDFGFDTGIYHKYNIKIYNGAQKLKEGDRLIAHYVPTSKLRRGIQIAKIYVTDEENKVLYEFKTPISLLKEDKPEPSVVEFKEAELN